MRRGTAGVGVAFALLLVLVPASVALAGTRDANLHRQVEAGLHRLAHGADPFGAFAFPARPVNQHSRELLSRFRVAGSPYQWGIDLVRSGGSFILEIGGARRQTTDGESVEQTHVWGFRLPLGDAAIGPELRHGHIRTGTALGPFGKIDLTFNSFRARRAHLEHGCGPRKTEIDGYRRPGTMHGSLALTFNEGSLPDLHASKMTATVAVGNLGETSCAHAVGQPAPVHPHPHCQEDRRVELRGPSNTFEAYGNTHDLELASLREQSGILEYHVLSIDGPTHLVHILPGGLAISSPHLPPVLSGSLTFDTVHSLTHTGRLCRITRATGAWASGTLSLHLDTGTIDLTGPGLRSNVRLKVSR
jgi:hypothetical protein